MNKLVSIVVPVYDAEEYLNDCLDSIINQTYENLEIILVDDGSTDNSGKICDDYAARDSRIEVIHCIKDTKGPGKARNTGAKAATGEYLLFVDNDDWIDRKLVERTVDVAEKNDAEVVLFHFERIENGIADKKPNTELDILTNSVMSAESNPEIIISSCSPVDKLYRKSFWDKNGFEFTVNRYFEDLGTIPKIMAVTERMIHIPDVLYFYRIRPRSIMRTPNWEEKFSDRTFVMEDIISFFESKSIYNKFISELEYIDFKHLYLYPSREIVYLDPKSKYLYKFRQYALGKFPELNKNKYISQMPANEKLFWFFIKHKMYHMPVMLSKLRRFVKRLFKK